MNRKQHLASGGAKNNSVHRVRSLFDSAQRHHQTGRFGEAEQLYRQILAIEPRHAESLHCLGCLEYQCGHNEDAVELISRAIEVKDGVSVFDNNLGNALFAQHRLDEAAACYRRALAFEPEFAAAHSNLANALRAQGRNSEALPHY
jgi:protein O-GlcNAc transferase